MAANPLAANPGLILDLLQSKKFRALLAYVALSCKPVQEMLGIEPATLPWITIAFAAFFLSQGFRDLGEEIVYSVKLFKDPPPKNPVPGFPVKPLT